MLRKIFRILGWLIIIALVGILITAQFIGKFRMSEEEAAKMFAEEKVDFKTVYLHINNRIMHYVVTGNDTLPTIVFIHGSPGSWDAFHRYLTDKDLLNRYRLISIDRPGFGYSDFGDALNFEGQGILLNAVLDSINNGKPAALLGHSLGGPMIIKLAAENHTLALKNIVMLAGSVDPKQEEPEKWRSVIGAFPLRYFIPGAMRPSNDELKWFKKDAYDVAKLFDKVTCNAIIMQGDSDQLVPPPNALYAQSLLVHAKSVQLIWLKHEDHFIPWSQYEAVKQQLLQLRDMQ